MCVTVCLSSVREITILCQRDYYPLSERLLSSVREITILCQRDYYCSNENIFQEMYELNLLLLFFPLERINSFISCRRAIVSGSYCKFHRYQNCVFTTHCMTVHECCPSVCYFWPPGLLMCTTSWFPTC